MSVKPSTGVKSTQLFNTSLLHNLFSQGEMEKNNPKKDPNGGKWEPGGSSQSSPQQQKQLQPAF